MSTVIVPEIHTILGRAAANRQRLNELLQVLDDEHWRRRHPDDAWDVRGHLQHLASIEPLLIGTLNEAVELGSAWLCGSPSGPGVEEAREAARTSLADLSPGELLLEIEETRIETVDAVANLEAAALDAIVRIPPVSEWLAPVPVPLRQYLQDWAIHDLDHEASIRNAITVQPRPADLASALRVRAKQPRP